MTRMQAIACVVESSRRERVSPVITKRPLVRGARRGRDCPVPEQPRAAADGPGRRTARTGTLDRRRPDARTRMSAKRPGGSDCSRCRPVESRSVTLRTVWHSIRATRIGISPRSARPAPLSPPSPWRTSGGSSPKPERRRALGRVIDVDQAKVDRRPVVAADAGGLRALPDQEAASIATAHVGHFGAASFFVVQSAEKGRSRLGTSRSRTTGYEQAAVISPSSPSTAACSHTGRLLGIGGMICSSRRSISTPSAPSWPTPGWTAASQARKRTLAATRL